MQNKRWVVAKRSDGAFNPEDYRFETVDLPSLGEGELRVAIEMASCDPGQMVWTRRDTYMPAVPLGETVAAVASGVVTESQNKDFSVGDRVSGMLGFQQFWQGKPRNLQKLPQDVAFEDSLGLFSHIGATAWSFIEVGKPNPTKNETVVVTGAAGAVGSIVCQLAKARNCKVVGIAGSAKKLEMLKKLGVDVAVNYKDKDFAEQLKKACDKGIDIYFENVGGAITETAWPLLNEHARIVGCGMISTYERGDGEEKPLALYSSDLIMKRIKFEGVMVMDYVDRWPDIFRELGAMRKNGQADLPLDIVEGIENTISALNGIYTGDNVGKRLVKI